MPRAAALLTAAFLAACAGPGRSIDAGPGGTGTRPEESDARPREEEADQPEEEEGREEPPDGPPAARPGADAPAPPDLSRQELQARIAARAASLLGHAGPFDVARERFPSDCSGFVEAVYEAEGVPLRALMRAAAPNERSGVVAAFRAMEAYGSIFRGRDDWPSPGDLVFWHDTYDRNRNGKTDDRLTHVGIVEYVADGTVVFLHRGTKRVVRGAMNRARPREKSADGVLLNSPIRSRRARHRGVPVLAGELFAAYGRLEP